MSGKNLAYINPKVLKWARVRSRWSFKITAKKAKVSVESLRKWEAGEGHPSFPAAERMAAALSIPFGYLYLSEPPQRRR